MSGFLTLVPFQRAAEAAAKKLGVTEPVRVVWERDCPGRESLGKHEAHCHVLASDSRGTICVADSIAEGTPAGIRSLMEHEVTHLVGGVPPGHGSGFKKALAAIQPASWEAKKLRREGSLAHAHRWKPSYLIGIERGQAILSERCDGCDGTRRAVYERVSVVD